MALARAAVEDCLRNKLAKLYGKNAVTGIDLKDMIDNLAPRARSLSPKGRNSAHKVRVAANEVLHPRPMAPAASVDAASVIEEARTVIMELAPR